jgi:hypothetical protein
VLSALPGDPPEAVWVPLSIDDRVPFGSAPPPGGQVPEMSASLDSTEAAPLCSRVRNC